MASINLGAQSYSFRQFDIRGAINCLKRLGLQYMEFCSVHFKPDPSEPAAQDAVNAMRSAGVKMMSFGVESFTADKAVNLRKFEFAKALGIEVLTADPAPESFDHLDALTRQFGVRIAIHNHGPESRYSTVKDILNAIRNHSPMIGACVDTGHALRSRENPHEVIEQLGERVVCLHLKDWFKGGQEQILGEGDLDLPAVVNALKAIHFRGLAVLEYENHPENPVPDMRIGLRNWQEAWK